jgi:hypothetical protein
MSQYHRAMLYINYLFPGEKDRMETEIKDVLFYVVDLILILETFFI